MSKIPIVRSLDPRIAVEAPQVFVAEIGPVSQTYQVVQPNQNSTSPTYTIACPSQGMGINRLMYQNVAGTIRITGTGLDRLNVGNCIALRPWPLARCMTSLRATINNCSVSMNPNLYMNALSYVATDSYEMQGVQSGTATCPDLCTCFDDIIGTNASPFETILSSNQSDQISSSRTAQITRIEYTADTSIDVSYNIYEPIVLSPFTYNSFDNQKSFFGVNNLVVDISYTTSMSQMLCYSIASGFVTAGTRITNIAPLPTGAGAPFSAMSLLVSYVSPSSSALVAIPRLISYNYSSLQQFPTTIPILTNGYAASISSNAAQLATIPRAFLIYASPSVNQLSAFSQNFTNANGDVVAGSVPDIFFNLSNINIQFGTYSGIFSSAVQPQLWQVAARNGIDVPFARWNGNKIVGSKTNGGNADGIVGTYAGAPFLVNVARDMQLPEGVTVGMQIQTQIVVNATVTNQTSENYSGCTFNVVAITDGFFDIEGGASSSYLGGITPDELQKAAPASPYQNSEVAGRRMANGYSGGKYSWNDFKSDMGKAAQYIAPVSKPIIEALTKKGVDQINGSGGALMQRGKVRQAVHNYY